MQAHPRVSHPAELLAEPRHGRLNLAVGRLASTTLGSMALFWITFLVPLVVIPASDEIKLIASIILSSWFQAWALPVLQSASNRAEEHREAKADVDHEALTHLALRVDQILRRLDERGSRTAP